MKAVRAQEIEYVRKMGLYIKVQIAECKLNTGKAPIAVRWIDINKGDSKEPNYRSRLVAKEINLYKRNGFFAATPPLEDLKMVTCMVATKNQGEILMVNDVSRAFFHAKAKRQVYVALPDEDRLPGEEQVCAKLQYSMYGTRDAALNWHKEYTQQLLENGFVQGVSTPCVFQHPTRNM